MKKQLENKKGITLIALVVTIIILLILAGVALNLVAGENGILKRTVDAREEAIKAQYEEELNLILATMRMDAMGNRQEFTRQYIIEKLPDYLEEEGKIDYDWDTEQNLEQPEGRYREYEFYIDTRFVAHIGSITTIYNPKINYSKEESLTLEVTVQYPKIENMNVRNEYSIDGQTYFEYSTPVEIKDDCTFYARVLNIDTGERIAYSEEIIKNINYVWERWEAIEKFRYELASEKNYVLNGNWNANPVDAYSEINWIEDFAAGAGVRSSFSKDDYQGAIGLYVRSSDRKSAIKIEKISDTNSEGAPYWVYTGTRYYMEKFPDGYDKGEQLEDEISKNKGDHVSGEVRDGIWYELKSK